MRLPCIRCYKASSTHPFTFLPSIVREGGEGSGRMLGAVEQDSHVKSRGHDGRTVVGEGELGDRRRGGREVAPLAVKWVVSWTFMHK